MTLFIEKIFKKINKPSNKILAGGFVLSLLILLFHRYGAKGTTLSTPFFMAKGQHCSNTRCLTTSLPVASYFWDFFLFY
jgi:hypothetical protein